MRLVLLFFLIKFLEKKTRKCLIDFQVIELDPEQLPEVEEVLSILRQEHSQINTWVNVAVS